MNQAFQKDQEVQRMELVLPGALCRAFAELEG